MPNLRSSQNQSVPLIWLRMSRIVLTPKQVKKIHKLIGWNLGHLWFVSTLYVLNADIFYFFHVISPSVFICCFNINGTKIATE